jgi:hypothetical protein
MRQKMNEILSDRKNKGNVTYRIVVSEDATRLFIELEKLMKVRSKEADKKTTKKVVFQNHFIMKNSVTLKMKLKTQYYCNFVSIHC